MKFSIRLRLTLWYTAVLSLILVIAFGVVYRIMHDRLEVGMEEKLDVGYATIENVVNNSGGDLFDVVHLGQEQHFLMTRADDPVYVTLAWEHTGLPKDLDQVQAVPYGRWQSSDGRLFKMKVGLIPEYGYRLAYALDFTEAEQNINTLFLILLISIPCAVVLALAGGYFMAGRALSPMTDLTRTAERITAMSLSERLPVVNPNDEIGELSTVFNETLARLDASFERLRQFTADASHELRTPLTAIRSVGEVALQAPGDAGDCREAVASMLIEVERLSRLLDNMLLLAYGDSGSTRLDPLVQDVSELMRRVIEDLKILAVDKEQSLLIEADSPVMAAYDAETLHQALTNILHNAIRYTPVGGEIRANVFASDGGRAVIEVSDSGPGIPEDQRERVFDRFYRIDKARSRADGGAGLGLAIARWAVEKNGGTVAFRDCEGPGACCRITLDLAGPE